MPNGKQPGESASACREDRRLRRTCVPPQLHPQLSPVSVPVPAVHQACISDRCVSFTILYWQQNWIVFSQNVSGWKRRGRLSPWWLQNVNNAEFKIHFKKMRGFPGVMETQNGLPYADLWLWIITTCNLLVWGSFAYKLSLPTRCKTKLGGKNIPLMM